MKARYLTAMLIAAGFACAHANATTYNLTLGTQSTYTVGVGHFTDEFDFTLNSSSNLTSTLSNLTHVNANNIKIELFDAANASLGSAQGSNASSVNFSSLASGNYHFLVSSEGIGGPHVTHSYDLGTAVAPAPEPEAWAMMGLGLAFVARVTRRKKSTSPAIA